MTVKKFSDLGTKLVREGWGVDSDETERAVLMDMEAKSVTISDLCTAALFERVDTLLSDLTKSIINGHNKRLVGKITSNVMRAIDIKETIHGPCPPGLRNCLYIDTCRAILWSTITWFCEFSVLAPQDITLVKPDSGSSFLVEYRKWMKKRI